MTSIAPHGLSEMLDRVADSILAGRLKRAFTFFIVSIAAVPHAGGAQSTLRGAIVADERERMPIQNAEVAIPQLGLSTRSDTSGKFEIRSIAGGRFRVHVRHIGHSPVQAEVAFTGRDTVEMTAILEMQARMLDTVDIKARVPGKFLEFHERRVGSTGSFLTRDQLARERDRPLAEAIARLPGMRLMRMGGGMAAVATARGEIRRGASGGDVMDRRRGAAPACYAQVILDNVPVFEPKPGAALFNINSLPVNSIEGIEFYSSSARTPARYSRYAGCGTLVIWTRIE